jgi:hypothetical protein
LAAVSSSKGILPFSLVEPKVLDVGLSPSRTIIGPMS